METLGLWNHVKQAFKGLADEIKKELTEQAKALGIDVLEILDNPWTYYKHFKVEDMIVEKISLFDRTPGTEKDIDFFRWIPNSLEEKVARKIIRSLWLVTFSVIKKTLKENVEKI